MCQQQGPGGIGGAMPGKFAYSKFSDDLELEPRRSLENIVAMSPEEMARASRLIVGTYNELLQTANSLEDEGYRRLMRECIAAPKVSFLELYPSDDDRRKMFNEMAKLGTARERSHGAARGAGLARFHAEGRTLDRQGYRAVLSLERAGFLCKPGREAHKTEGGGGMCQQQGPGGIGGAMPGKFAYSKFSDDLELEPRRSLENIVAMSPEEMARASRLIVGTYNELLQTANSLEDEGYRRLMRECIAAPKVSFLELYPSDDDRRKMFNEMVKLGFFNPEDDPDHVWPRGHMDPQTYLTAPSSHNDFYNAHPGGLALTVAYNIRTADAYTENYRQMYGLPINRDLPVVSLLVHEYPKVWLYQWLDDGSWLEEPRTVYDDTWHAHCVYVTAELMYRRYDSRIVMAMAAAHQMSMLDASMDGRAVVANWIGLDRVCHFIKSATVSAKPPGWAL